MIMRNRMIKRLLIIVLTVFILLNIVAFFHAYKFTHFSSSNSTKTKDARELSFVQKVATLCFGVSNPRPENKMFPNRAYETIKLKGNTEIECWLLKTDSTKKGTVILFHGYGSHKSALLDKAEVFLQLGFNALLVDFMGSGGSEGITTTIGFYEAEEVKTAFDYVTKQGEKNIILNGISMGAVAIMKAQSDFKLNPAAIIIECPFGTMLETVQARFKTMKVPSFPMANLLVFWGGVQNNFNAFKHNPSNYAKNINCPALLLYGEKDNKVSNAETDLIFNNLQGEKMMKKFPLAGHENYLIKYRSEWIAEVKAFLSL